MELSQKRKEQVEAVKAALKIRAHAFRISVEDAAADQIADMKTSARDSIIRGAIFGLIIGIAIGAMAF